MDAGHGVVVVGCEAEGVESQTVLAEPKKRAIALGGGFDGGMGDGRAGAKDERRKGGDGYATDGAIGGEPLDGSIVYLDATVLQVKGSPSILGRGQGVERWTFKNGHEPPRIYSESLRRTGRD